jgi:hypothetical protein
LPFIRIFLCARSPEFAGTVTAALLREPASVELILKLSDLSGASDQAAALPISRLYQAIMRAMS